MVDLGLIEARSRWPNGITEARITEAGLAMCRSMSPH